MHPLQHVYALFNITPMTLRRWCCRAGVKPHISASDHRYKYLDNAQLVLLARLHQRVVVVDNVDTLMLEQIGELSRKVRELEAILGNKKDQTLPRG